MSKIVFVPLDERPCNMTYPQYIGKISNMDLCMPPVSLLGKFKKSADVDALWDWVFFQAQGASRLILSMDMMLYGGIVPSRLHHLSEEVCQKRIDRLKELKLLYPGLGIDAFQLITRAPARDGSGEEPDYYENYGYRIFRYGVISDRIKTHLASEEELQELETIRSQVPDIYLSDFLERRAVNYENHLKTIELVEKGIIDFLIIPLDDCREHGFAPAERRRLGTELAQRHLLNRVLLYPGADETGCTLVARAVNRLNGIRPCVFVDYSSLKGRMQIPAYEDRSIGETVPFHLMAAGCVEAETSGEADFVLAVHPPTAFSLRLEKELVTKDMILESERNIPAFLSRIKRYMDKGLSVGIADCAIPNKADRVLMEFLYEEGMLNRLTSFGAWNTSSNTLGTVLAHLCSWNAAAHTPCGDEAGRRLSEEFLFSRFLEDWGYMAEVREGVTDMLASIDPSIHRLDLKDSEPLVREVISERLRDFHKRYLPSEDYEYEISIPWNRMFEIAVTIKQKEN